MPDYMMQCASIHLLSRALSRLKPLLTSVGMDTFTLDHCLLDEFRHLGYCEMLGLGWRCEQLSSSSSTCDCWCVGTHAFVSQKVAEAKPSIEKDGAKFEMPILYKKIIPFGGEPQHFLGWVQVFCGMDFAPEALHSALHKIVPRYTEGPERA